MMITTEYFWLFLLIIGPNVFRSGSCVPQTKEKEINRLRKTERLALYEERHFNDYQTKKEIYKKWPELDRDNLVQSCQLYLLSVFPRSVISTTNGRVRNIFLFYKETKDITIINESNPVEVAALVCVLLQPINRRRYMHFTRSPKPEYVYLMNHLRKRHPMEFNIVAAVQLGNGTPRLRQTYKEYKTRRRERKIERYNDTPEEQLAYEKEHYKYYHSDEETYKKWPELENIGDKNEHCRKLLNWIFPRTDLSKTHSTMSTTTLGYPKLQTTNEINFRRVIVAELVCFIPQRTNHNRFHFIRAPNLNCTFLLQQVQASFIYFRISKRYCEDVEQESHTDEGDAELPNTDEFGPAIGDNYDSTFDITDLPIDDVRMELIWSD